MKILALIAPVIVSSHSVGNTPCPKLVSEVAIVLVGLMAVLFVLVVVAFMKEVLDSVMQNKRRGNYETEDKG